MKVIVKCFFVSCLSLPSVAVGAAAATPAEATRPAPETAQQTQIKNIQEYLLVLYGMMHAAGSAAGEDISYYSDVYEVWSAAMHNAREVAGSAAEWVVWDAAGYAVGDAARHAARGAARSAVKSVVRPAVNSKDIEEPVTQVVWEEVFAQNIVIKRIITNQSFQNIQPATMEQVLAAVERLMDIDTENFKKALPQVQLYYALAVQEIVKLTNDRQIQKKFQEFLTVLVPEARAGFEQFNRSTEPIIEGIIESTCHTQEALTAPEGVALEQSNMHKDGRSCMPVEVAKLITGYAGVTPLSLFFLAQQKRNLKR